MTTLARVAHVRPTHSCGHRPPGGLSTESRVKVKKAAGPTSSPPLACRMVTPFLHQHLSGFFILEVLQFHLISLHRLLPRHSWDLESSSLRLLAGCWLVYTGGPPVHYLVSLSIHGYPCHSVRSLHHQYIHPTITPGVLRCSLSCLCQLYIP